MRWVVLGIALMFSVRYVQAQEDWSFAFVVETGDSYELWVVDPARSETRHIPLPTADSWLVSASASPDGTEILFWLGRSANEPRNYAWNEQSILRILNLETGELQDAARFLNYAHGDSHDLARAYAPNGRYVILHDHLIDLSTNEALPFDIPTMARSWSPDRHLMAVGNLLCRERQCYGITMGLIQMPQMRRLQTVISRDWFDVCNLQWSPNQRRIVFEVRCSVLVSGTIGHGELIMWDLATNTLVSLTDYTVSPQEYYEQLGGVRDGTVDYSILWVNNETLLESVSHWDIQMTPNGGVPDPDTFRVGTTLHQLPENHTIHVNDSKVNVWALDPVHQRIAYQIEEITLNERGDAEATNLRTEIATLEDNQLLVEKTLVSGCNLSWSPDGAWLAFTESNPHPYDRWYTCVPEQVLYITVAGASDEPPIKVELPEHSFLVGWVRSSQIATPFFPLGTPTPLPTPFPGVG